MVAAGRADAMINESIPQSFRPLAKARPFGLLEMRQSALEDLQAELRLPLAAGRRGQHRRPAGAGPRPELGALDRRGSRRPARRRSLLTGRRLLHERATVGAAVHGGQPPGAGRLLAGGANATARRRRRSDDTAASGRGAALPRGGRALTLDQREWRPPHVVSRDVARPQQRRREGNPPRPACQLARRSAPRRAHALLGPTTDGLYGMYVLLAPDLAAARALAGDTPITSTGCATWSRYWSGTRGARCASRTPASSADGAGDGRTVGPGGSRLTAPASSSRLPRSAAPTRLRAGKDQAAPRRSRRTADR